MQDFSIGAGLSAIGFWLFIAGIVVAGIWDAARKREAQHETLRRMVESGREIDPELMDKVLGSRRPDRELKIGGIVTLAVAPGLALLGALIGLNAPSAFLPILGAGLLVGCVGGGLLIAARYAERAYRDDPTTRG